MKRVLSFDPGYTTGIAVYDEQGVLELSITATKERVYKGSFLTKLVALSQPEVVLIEDLPINNVNKEVFDLHYYIKHWFKTAGYDVIDIRPSQWKGLVQRVEIPGQHARDAATMARWFINQSKKE